MRVALCPKCEALHTPHGVVFDPLSGRTCWPGGAMRLPPAHGRLFGCLFARVGHPVRTDTLLQALYDGPDGGPLYARNILGIHVVRIRKNMMAAGFPGEIRTHYRVGYELILHPMTQQAAEPEGAAA